ncbi:MAG: hypothetical protein DMF69_08910 [Acidobacteria bacterium]|nr:MAG: hypothetical protein DMF69_08910 [Acidobacteriota bacterium]
MIRKAHVITPAPEANASRSRFSLHVAWTVIARVVMIANSLLAGVIVAHWLGAEGVGKLAVINVSVMTLVQLGSLGLPSANTYFISKEPGHFRIATLNSLVFALLCGTLLAVGLAIVAQLRPSWFGFVSPDLFRVAAISIPFQLLNLIGLNIFLAIGRIREFNLLDLAGQSFVLINALVVLIIMHSGLGTLVLLNSAASVVVGLIVIALLVHLGKKPLENAAGWRTDIALFRQMMQYGIKSHISILAGTLVGGKSFPGSRGSRCLYYCHAGWDDADGFAERYRNASFSEGYSGAGCHRRDNVHCCQVHVVCDAAIHTRRHTVEFDTAIYLWKCLCGFVDSITDSSSGCFPCWNSSRCRTALQRLGFAEGCSNFLAGHTRSEYRVGICAGTTFRGSRRRTWIDY